MYVSCLQGLGKRCNPGMKELTFSFFFQTTVDSDWKCLSQPYWSVLKLLMSWLAGGNNYAPPKSVFIVRADEIISAWLLDRAVWQETTSSSPIVTFPFCHLQWKWCLKRSLPPTHTLPLHPCLPVVPTLTVRVLLFASCFFFLCTIPPSHHSRPSPPLKMTPSLFLPSGSLLSTFHPFPSLSNHSHPPGFNSHLSFWTFVLNVLALWVTVARLHDKMFKICLVFWLVKNGLESISLIFGWGWEGCLTAVSLFWLKKVNLW